MEKELSVEKDRPCREKYWSELSIEEKIERTRNQVKSLQSQIGHLDQKIDQLLEHAHFDGKIVITLDRYGHGGDKEEGRIRGSGKDDVYF